MGQMDAVQYGSGVMAGVGSAQGTGSWAGPAFAVSGGNAGFGCLLPPCLPFPSKPERGFEMLITNFTWSVKGSLSYFDVFLMRSGASQCKAEAHSGR